MSTMPIGKVPTGSMPNGTLRIGIMALQGAVAPHRRKIVEAGAEAVLVRSAEELFSCHGLIFPGGESSTYLNLMTHYGLMEPVRSFAATHACWGVCAGSILMAEAVENPAQACLGLVPITVRRNAYGRQNESFITRITLALNGSGALEQEAVFIRAPKIVRWDHQVLPLAWFEGDPIVIQHGHHLVSTFHPELSEPLNLHRHFIAMCKEKSGKAVAGA